MSELPSFGVLISGRGSNMTALVDAARRGDVPARPAVVISNVADAPGLAAARARGVPTRVVDHRRAPSRAEHDRRCAAVLREHGVELVCLAGYMRILTRELIAAFPNRILNVHPALLPAFPGLEAQAQAFAYGVKVSGCTVHFVDERVDHGPIVIQAPVAVLDDDTVETLAARILEEEHRIYPEAVRLYFERRLHVAGRRVLVR